MFGPRVATQSYPIDQLTFVQECTENEQPVFRNILQLRQDFLYTLWG